MFPKANLLCSANSVAKWLIRALLIDAGIAITVPLFRSFLDPQATFPVLVRQYLYSVIYSNLIGIPLCAILPVVWVRSLGKPAPLRLVVRGTVVLVCNIAGCLLAGLVLRFVFGQSYGFWSSFQNSLGVSLVLSAVVVSFVSMYESQEAKLKVTAMELKTKELERERALKLATEARLSSLEARIHPHFLFNTINSVSSLIHEDPYRAEKILTQLAELLRFSLDAAPRGLVPLERELQIVEDYLEIEKARFGSRLKFVIDVPAGLHGVPVPPLSVQTLVENSVKYAVGPRGRGTSISIHAVELTGCLRLEVIDDGPGFKNRELPARHGLSNLQERLFALFGDEAKLDIVSEEGGATVTLEIPSRPDRTLLQPAPNSENLVGIFDRP